MGKAIHEKWNFYKFLVLGTKKLIDDSPAGGGVGSLNELPNFRNEGLDSTSIFRGSWWERGGRPFSGGVSFYIKIKLKSQIFGA